MIKIIAEEEYIYIYGGGRKAKRKRDTERGIERNKVYISKKKKKDRQD